MEYVPHLREIIVPGKYYTRDMRDDHIQFHEYMKNDRIEYSSQTHTKPLNFLEFRDRLARGE